ncbi:hypothetical protein HDU78_011144 [Chytriomyces hyalinus]|nr:hypothetical protein HDU78_011144 [Chytriomyces hyalinus]KAJ3249155.1 hypothetical protein HDU77_007837 [Chytriomyces hyalinus]
MDEQVEDTDERQRRGTKSSDKARTHKRRRSDSVSSVSSDSSSDSDSSSSSSSDSGAEKSRKKKRSKDDKDKKKKKRKSKEKEKEKDKKKRKKKDKKKKKSKKTKSSSKASSEWGQYGVISTTDMYLKEAEFRSWLVEVKRISPEDRDSKKYFDEFVEDFNTGTLPHKKYYNMDAWDRETMNLNSGGGGIAGAGDALEFDFARDEAMLKAQQRMSGKSWRVPVAPIMTDEELRDLKRVNEERIAMDRLRKMGVETKSSSAGVRYEKKML